MARNDKQEVQDTKEELNTRGITGLANAQETESNKPPVAPLVADENLSEDEKMRLEDAAKAQEFQPEVEADPVPRANTTVVGRKERPEEYDDPDAGKITVDELIDALEMTDIRVRKGGKFVSIREYVTDLRRAKREDQEFQRRNK